MASRSSAPNEFNQNVALIEKSIAVRASNEVSVELRSAPGSGFVLEIVGVDNDPPVITVDSPVDGATLTTATVAVIGRASDALSGLAAVTCNGVAATIADARFQCDLTLAEGPHIIQVEATDVAGNRSARAVAVTVVLDTTPPAVTIRAPPNLTLFNTGPITVFGTIDDPEATVVVNGVAAVIAGGAFSASGVALREGANTITATATDRVGNAATASITVVLDATAPTVRIDTPSEGAVLSQPTVTVTGMVNDIVTGTVNAEDATVTVNGRPATVLNRSFVVSELPLKRGPNTIVAVAQDRAGNSGTAAVEVTLEEVAGQRVTMISGNDQAGIIGSTLPLPLVVRLSDLSGNPIANRPVTFAVSRGDGTVAAGAAQDRTVTVFSGSNGLASVLFTLGTRTGAGNQRVTARSVGFVGEAVFCASAVNSPPAGVKTLMSDPLTGAVGTALPMPFVAVVHDAGGNPVQGVPVIFEVVSGGGSLGGASSATILSNDDGRASVVLTLGPDPGVANNVVHARFEGLTGLPAVFTASAAVPGRAADTRVSGVVLDNANIPMERVTVSIAGTALKAVTTSDGQFTIPAAPVGTIHLHVDGTTTTRTGVWPHLEFVLTTVAGQDNTVGMPIYLLPLDTENAKVVGGSTDVTLTMKDVPGLSLTVFANSARFADGSRTGPVTITQVHFDKVPMAPIEGAAPRLTWTVQPAGVHFDPPARITYPNIDGLRPGQVVDIFSFDHDLGEFVSVGTGTVSADGSVITSDPGMGIRKAGWGYPQPPPPPTTEPEKDPCEDAAKKANERARTDGDMFGRIQACIAQAACKNRDQIKDPVLTDRVLPKFIDKWVNGTGDWPANNARCAAVPDPFCAALKAKYHITVDLADALNSEGCGSVAGWDAMMSLIDTCMFNESSGLAAVRPLITLWRNEVRDACLEHRGR